MDFCAKVSSFVIEKTIRHRIFQKIIGMNNAGQTVDYHLHGIFYILRKFYIPCGIACSKKIKLLADRPWSVPATVIPVKLSAK